MKRKRVENAVAKREFEEEKRVVLGIHFWNSVFSSVSLAIYRNAVYPKLIYLNKLI
jgi:hypothetical protein